MNELFESVRTILLQEIEEEPTRKELASYAEAIDKLVGIGTHLLEWDWRDESITIDEKTVVAVFFMQMRI
jgi:hypothetical protein